VLFSFEIKSAEYAVSIWTFSGGQSTQQRSRSCTAEHTPHQGDGVAATLWQKLLFPQSGEKKKPKHTGHAKPGEQGGSYLLGERT